MLSPSRAADALPLPLYETVTMIGSHSISDHTTMSLLDPSSKAVKVRFVEKPNRTEVLDFNLFLSATTAWGTEIKTQVALYHYLQRKTA